MKTLMKIVLVALLLTPMLFTACGSKPQAVSKSTYDATAQEVNDAESTVTRLRAENKQLQEDLAAAIAKREALQKLADEKK